ncbi:MAG TPA: RdgB/HAM1 family non-canonical purine NTP pyrophosphatase [Alphaproteobacteria bacterium]|nr:RdgB/HAM1 family non-canonical purine NTP pyrophosphatase [Alphaproteobacteria bacterium]HOO50138.1 RdgB/HAM1 family non-canonical purine NTP pyrophosphatase [Alphaproteobacteria bacterium]
MRIEKLVLATHNAGKVAEMSDLLAPYGIEVLSAKDFDLDAPEETENTFEGNAFIKARFVAKETGLPALADDSGLCVNTLKGEPGVYSADWAGPEKDFGKAMILVNDKMGQCPDRSAYFISVFAFVLPDGREMVFEGRCDGSLIWPPRGAGGFGYDPMFVPKGEGRSFGEMDMSEKKKYSHRAKAFAEFRKIFE